jgi:hypothetical protein
MDVQMDTSLENTLFQVVFSKPLVSVVGILVDSEIVLSTRYGKVRVLLCDLSLFKSFYGPNY